MRAGRDRDDLTLSFDHLSRERGGTGMTEMEIVGVRDRVVVQVRMSLGEVFRGRFFRS